MGHTHQQHKEAVKRIRLGSVLLKGTSNTHWNLRMSLLGCRCQLGKAEVKKMKQGNRILLGKQPELIQAPIGQYDPGGQYPKAYNLLPQEPT